LSESYLTSRLENLGLANDVMTNAVDVQERSLKRAHNQQGRRETDECEPREFTSVDVDANVSRRIARG